MPLLSNYAFEILKKSQSEGRLGHAYLFSSPSENLLEQFAISLIQWLFPKEKISRKNLFEFSENEWLRILRPQSKSGNIRIEEIRGLEKFLYLSSPKQQLKVCFLFQADKLTVESANAFLKTLEEPPERSLILLFSPSESLLPTILSRCIRLPLCEENPNHESGEFPRFFSQLATRVQKKQFSLADTVSLKEVFWKELSEKKREINLSSKGKSSLEDRGNLLQSRFRAIRNKGLEEILYWLGDALRASQGIKNDDLPSYQESSFGFAQIFSTEEIGERIFAIRDLQKKWQTNVQEELALEVAFIQAFGPLKL